MNISLLIACLLHACCFNLERYQAVFGPTLERRSMDLGSRNTASMDTWTLEEEKVCTEEDEYKDCNYANVSISCLYPKTAIFSFFYLFLITAREYNQCFSKFDRIRQGLVEGHQVKIIKFRKMNYGLRHRNQTTFGFFPARVCYQNAW